MADCELCGKPQRADTAYVCRACGIDLAGDPNDPRKPGLLNVAADLWPELLTTCAGQARMAQPGPQRRGRAPAEPTRPDSGVLRHYVDQVAGNVTGLPFSWAAAEVVDTVRNTATTWARVIWAERAPAPVAGPACAECNHRTCRQIMYQQIKPPADTPGLLRWLAGQVEWIRHQPLAAEALDELGYAARLVAPAVDRPAVRVRVAVGPCPEVDCLGLVTATVPARLDVAAVLRCDGCGAEWGTQQWARVGRRMMARTERMGA